MQSSQQLSPYEDVAPSDPSIDELRRLVCDAAHRPPVDPAWHQDAGLACLSGTMAMCWHANPTVRHTSLAVKLQLRSVLEALENPLKQLTTI